MLPCILVNKDFHSELRGFSVADLVPRHESRSRRGRAGRPVAMATIDTSSASAAAAQACGA